MAALNLLRERCGQDASSGPRPAPLDARRSPPAAQRHDKARILRLRRSRWAWTAAFWLCAVLALSGIGVAIGTALESPMLGFLGADFVFLLVVSAFTSGQSIARRERH